MQKNVFTREEFLARFNISEETLTDWERLKLLKPVGYADDKVPCYAEDLGGKIQHIQRLSELGYGPEEIQKIIKKVGLPKSPKEKEKTEELGEFLTVGNLAERAGLSPRTIKYWEDKGIIEPDMRSEGGFRLYSGVYVTACELIRDLQLFGYSLEEIKEISDYVRDFFALRENKDAFSKTETARRLEGMLEKVEALFEKMNLLREGIKRWEDLLKKTKKQISELKNNNEKKGDKSKGKEK